MKRKPVKDPQLAKTADEFLKLTKLQKSHKQSESDRKKSIKFKSTAKSRRLAFLARHNYSAYLKTAHWQDVRRRKLSGRRICDVCLSGGDLEVHHRTYERVGRELMCDLRVLCSGCHSVEHEKDGKRPRDRISVQFREIVAGAIGGHHAS